MAKFSDSSLKRLATCHEDLQKLFLRVVEQYDCVILEGHRGEAEQTLAFETGKSQKQWPNGNHNKLPSQAVDVSPFPVNWEDKSRWYHFAGYVQGVAMTMGIKIRWGGDWDGDKNLKNQTFFDLPHFELIK